MHHRLNVFVHGDPRRFRLCSVSNLSPLVEPTRGDSWDHRDLNTFSTSTVKELGLAPPTRLAVQEALHGHRCGTDRGLSRAAPRRDPRARREGGVHARVVMIC